MADSSNQENNPLNSEQLKSMTLKDRIDYYNNQDLVDITNGLYPLIQTADEMEEFILTRFLENGQSRYPILVDKKGKALMIGGARIKNPQEDYSHKNVLMRSGKQQEDFSFVTSIDGMQTNGPYLGQPYLELQLKDKKIQANLGITTDLYIPPIDKHHGGIEFLNKTFSNIEGVTVHVPASWK